MSGGALQLARVALLCLSGACAALGSLAACATAEPSPAAAPPPPAIAPAPTPLWLDVDTAAGVPRRDVDDAVALVQAFHSPELAIRGVSVVFGNTDLDRALPIAREVTERFGPPGLQVHRGAASAAELGLPTDATRALAAALEAEPLTVAVLGPATNLASLLVQRPDLAPRVTAVIAVAGRRPGQRFTTGTTHARGHRDFNFEQDPEAFRVLLRHDIPLILAPWEISSTVWMTQAQLDRLAAGPPAARWLAASAPSWLALWRDTFAVEGFNPFDTLAIAALTRPDLIACDTWPVHIITAPDDVPPRGAQGGSDPTGGHGMKPYLVVDPKAPTARRARYCHTADPSFREDLMQRLLAHRPAPGPARTDASSPRP